MKIKNDEYGNLKLYDKKGNSIDVDVSEITIDLKDSSTNFVVEADLKVYMID